MTRHKTPEAEILPGLTASELQELLASINQGVMDGTEHLVTVREYAAKKSQMLGRPVSDDQARKDIKALMSIGKAKFGGMKPQLSMDNRMQQAPGYEILV